MVGRTGSVEVGTTGAVFRRSFGVRPPRSSLANPSQIRTACRVFRLRKSSADTDVLPFANRSQTRTFGRRFSGLFLATFHVTPSEHNRRGRACFPPVIASTFVNVVMFVSCLIPPQVRAVGVVHCFGRFITVSSLLSVVVEASHARTI